MDSNDEKYIHKEIKPPKEKMNNATWENYIKDTHIPTEKHTHTHTHTHTQIFFLETKQGEISCCEKHSQLKPNKSMVYY